MTGVNIKALLDKCGDLTTTLMNIAAGQAVNRTHYEVTVEHFLLACLSDAHSDVSAVAGKLGVKTEEAIRGLNSVLDDFRSGNTGRPVFSPLLLELLEAAWLISSVDLGFSRIRTGAVFLAFLRKPAVYSQGLYSESFSIINSEELLRNFVKLTESSSEGTILTSGSGESSATGITERAGDSFIAKFCEDFTAKAKAGKIDPVFGRDQEIRQMVDILARRRKNNPILVGEPGVGKTAVLEGLALRIVQGDIPEVLRGVSLLSLDLGLLEAGAGMKGEFERRLKGVLDEIKASEKPIVLFIDEAHMLVGAGGQGGGSDAANLMKPALARGEIRTCAATTWKEYKKYFEKDAALARRFQLVKLDEPSPETAALILRGIRDNYERAHKVLIRDDALESAANLAHRYITGRFLPDKAIDLLDTACARVKVSLSSKPAALEDKERAAQAAEREYRGVERDKRNGLDVDEERMKALAAQIDLLGKEAKEIETRWLAEKAAAEEFIRCREVMLTAAADANKPERASAEPASKDAAEIDEKPAEDIADSGSMNTKNTVNTAATASLPSYDDARKAFEASKTALESLREANPLIHVEVTSDVIAQVVADWTGIPVGRMAQEQAGISKNLEEILSKRIKGQDMALKALTRVIQASSAGLKSPNQPIGVFLLVGPSGVGKTETGLSLAEVLFGDERGVVTINMSEFQEKHTVSRLIGSPPGYVGYGEGGMLTEAVRRRPYSVVLLDEVEKAHKDVMNLFYQVFDKGILTDGEGKEVSFKNTVIMLTSNLASDIIKEMTSENEEEVDVDIVTSAIRPVLTEHFLPALLARMSIVPFRSLPASALKNIAELKLASLQKRLAENNGMVLSYSPAVPQQIADRCTETDTGARNIEYIMSGAVLPRLAHNILEHMADGGMPSSVALDVSEDGEFTMTFGD